MTPLIWTSTKNVLTAHGEDDVFSRHGIGRVKASAVSYLENFKWEDDLTVYTTHDRHIYTDEMFFKGLKRIMDYIVSGSDYSMRKVTIIYIPTENAVYLMGGNTFVQCCFKCEVTKKLGKFSNDGFAIQISYDTLKEIVAAISSEFRITGTSILHKSDHKVTFACKSEDANGTSEVRYLLFSVECIKNPDCDAVLEMFQQYETGNPYGYQILYRINADTRLKNIFSGKQKQLQFVNRKGLLSLKLKQDEDSVYAIEAPTACPLIPMSDIGMAKEGETIANVDGKDLYEILSLEKDLVFTLDIIGGTNRNGTVVSPCIKVDSNKITILISQNINIQFPETRGFVMKKGSKFVEASEKEALEKAAKTYTPKNLSEEGKSRIEEVLSQLGERLSSAEQGIEKLGERLKANEKAVASLLVKMNEVLKAVADLKEPAIVETPEMMKTLQELPNAKDNTNMSYKVRDYLIKQAGNVIMKDIVIQEVPGATSNIRAYLGTCTTLRRIYKLDNNNYFVPSDIGTRFKGNSDTNLPFRLKDFPQDVINKFGLKDRLN